MKRFLISIIAILGIFIIAVIGGSFYMLDFSLKPDEARGDTALAFRQLTERHPEVKPWLDSLRACNGLRDTFITMPTGERHHGYFVRRDSSNHTAIIIHGWRDTGAKFMHIARIYHQKLGYNVLMPELHAHGLSEGDAVGMGWNDRKDVLHWMEVASKLFNHEHLVIHGVSMGAATTMNVSGEPMPKELKSLHFVEDCGYMSVWDEFSYQLGEEFGLPEFPLMYSTSLLCKLKYGWSFSEASPLEQIKKCNYPMLFIHGDADDFVPTFMVHPLYEAKPGKKELWITKDAAHARSYDANPQEYAKRIRAFLNN